MRPIVVDTNCLVQMLPKQSPYRVLWDNFLCGKWNLCVSTEVLDEYAEIITRLMGERVAKSLINVIMNSPYTLLYSPCYRFEIITVDRDDNKFVDLAITAGAEYLVTNDRHFQEAKDCPWPKVNVINIEEFLGTL